MTRDVTPRQFPYPTVGDCSGILSIVDEPLIPFPVRRVYMIAQVPTGAVRGGHAHKTLHQIFLAVGGSFVLELDDGRSWKESFEISQDQGAVYVPPGYWRTLTEFGVGAVAVVLASAAYDANDYIRDRREFECWAQS